MKYTISLLKGGTVEGCPTYTGVYMRAGSLVFRQIVSPSPIDWSVGDFVDYSDKTGFMYFLMDIPQVRKQSRGRLAGDAFVYDNVTFYDYMHYAELWPFRDLVTGDNTVHFSSRQAFSTYEAVDGIAKRIQASFDAMQPRMFVVEVSENAPGDVIDLMAEAREFSVSQCAILDALNKIGDVWPGVGWCYEPVTSGGAPVGAKITIGENFPAVGSFAYGIGRGLKSLTRVAANVGDVVNQIFPFGNTTNMPPRYYNGNTSIRNYQSVDIPNLMPPVSDWGLTDGKHDPAKAFYELSGVSDAQRRPRRVYFDGSNDLEDIYPTIKGLTVGDVIDYESAHGGVEYPPSSSDWSVDQPLDEVLSVQPDLSDDSITAFDNGVGKSLLKFTRQMSNDDHAFWTDSSASVGTPINSNAGFLVGKRTTRAFTDVKVAPYARNLNATIYLGELSGQTNGDITITSAYAKLSIRWTEHGAVKNWESNNSLPMSVGAYGNTATLKSSMDIPMADAPDVKYIDANTDIYVGFKVYIEGSVTTAGYVSIRRNFSGDFGFDVLGPVLTNFRLSIPPIGYDLTNLSATDGTVRVAMTSGKCAGREFEITTCAFDAANGATLTLKRQYDESISTYFPNTDYPVEEGDTFILLGISLPGFYITGAENRLKAAAQQYLAENGKTIWQYTPEVDAKYMLENGLTIRPGQYMRIIDPDIVDTEASVYLQYLKEHGGAYYLTESDEKIILDGGGKTDVVLVDSVTISEGDSNIPTWKVVLRDRKKK